MVEWCERCGLNDVADVIRLAMKKLSGDAYPRSQEGRQRLLANFLFEENESNGIHSTHLTKNSTNCFRTMAQGMMMLLTSGCEKLVE